MNEDSLIRLAEAKHLRKLQNWAWYIRGARMMLLRLREHFLCEEPHPGDAKRVTAEDKIYNKAILDLVLSSKANVDHFLLGGYDICFTDHERDKKGKLVKCRAYFAKKVIKYEEIEDNCKQNGE